MALLVTGDGVYAGGLGGVARYTPDAGWRPLNSGLALRAVTALACGTGDLLAGGDGGIARALDGGESWRRCAVPEDAAAVTALAPSPSPDEESTALAGTFGSGILRSTDGGASWQSSHFGLGSHEVLSLAWGSGESVIAATANGLFRSPNGGRAWRAIPETAGRVFVALTTGPGEKILAAPEVGPPLWSTGDLVNWKPYGGLPDNIQTSAMVALPDGRMLLGTINHGLLRSDDEGLTWSEASPRSVLCLVTDGAAVYAGTEAGVLLSEDSGETWRDLPLPPLHDLRHLHLLGGMPLVSGIGSFPVIFDPREGWTIRPETPLPLTGLFPTPDGVIFASSPDGLFLSKDRCASWSAVISGKSGAVTQVTFGSAGRIWAGLTPEGALLRSSDDSKSWEHLPSPFGVLPLIALQFVPGTTNHDAEELFAVTYDERRQAAAIWRSRDGGREWARGADIATPWPVATTGDNPPLVAVGNAITVQQSSGEWQQTTLVDRGVRQIASNASMILALGIDALWRSGDQGMSWTQDDLDLPIDQGQVLDIALDAGSIYALLSGGRLWSRRL